MNEADLPDWGAEPDWPKTSVPSANDISGEGGEAAAVHAGQDDAVGTVFPNFQSWVFEWLAPTICRPLRGGVTWCPRWWAHDEAALRLDALWQAWETARLEGGAAMSYWWEMHFDAHWAALTSDTGPFAACKDLTHSDKLQQLPVDYPPEDWTFLHTIDRTRRT